MKAIDLGKTFEDAIPTLARSDSDEMHYPSLYLELGDYDSFPESGILEVRFKKRSETTTTTKGKTECRVELDITKILDIEENKSKPDRGAQLDKYKEEAEEEDED